MTEIGFYHLTRTTAEAALPKLLGRTLALGQRAVVVAGSEERLAAISTALWLSSDPDWLPHGDARTGHAAHQPIWLTTRPENPNGATFLFLLDGIEADESGWRRVFDLFDGNDPAAVEAARARWRARQQAGHAVTYNRQTATGWERKPTTAATD
jgi:DNA polymerase-3 subunit chi